MLLDLPASPTTTGLIVPFVGLRPRTPVQSVGPMAALRFWRAGSAEEFLGRDFAEHGIAA